MKPHEEWLFKAENDLESARILLKADKKLYDVVVYHAQQCAEKALKAYLAEKNSKIDKTHSLAVLTEYCAAIDNDFLSLKDAISFLNPYVIMYRYPLDELMPPKKDTETALQYADTVLEFVKRKI